MGKVNLMLTHNFHTHPLSTKNVVIFLGWFVIDDKLFLAQARAWCHQVDSELCSFHFSTWHPWQYFEYVIWKHDFYCHHCHWYYQNFVWNCLHMNTNSALIHEMIWCYTTISNHSSQCELKSSATYVFSGTNELTYRVPLKYRWAAEQRCSYDSMWSSDEKWPGK